MELVLSALAVVSSRGIDEEEVALMEVKTGILRPRALIERFEGLD